MSSNQQGPGKHEFHSAGRQFASVEEEIQYLRKELAEKERIHNPENSQEREQLAHEVIREYKELPLEKVVVPEKAVTPEEAEGIVLNLKPEEHDHIIEEIYSFMLERGIRNAIELVLNMDNPHIEDDFHRFIVQYLLSGYEVPGLKPKSDLEKTLEMRLFEIVLPLPKEEVEQDYKNIATLMEQFMAGMQAISDHRIDKDERGNYYSLEMAKPEGEAEMFLYVAVPAHRANLFEKHILSLFEDVRITEIYDDYNIFPYEGIASASYAEIEPSDVLQINTYEELSHDPMKMIINAFSKVNDDGEGAAIQIVVKPVGDRYIKEYGKVLDRLKEGKKLEEAIGDVSVVKDLAKGFKEFFVEKSEEEKKEEHKTDDDAIQSVTSKLASTIVQTNIRIVSAAKSKMRADEILLGIESAFNQFNNTKGGRFTFRRVEKHHQLEEILYDYIFRNFIEDDIVRLNLKELATIFHFPIGISKSAQLKEHRMKIAPAPPETPTEGIILGLNEFRHRKRYVHFAPEDRLRHFYVIGQTGTGKTHLLKTMIVQDILNGDGVCFIDPHGSDIQDIIRYIPPERIDDVIYFDPAYTERPFGLNMLDYDKRYPEQKSFVINELLSIFNKLFDMKATGGPMFEQYFRNAAGLVMEHPESGNTLLEIIRVMSDKAFRDMKLRYCKNPVIAQFWANAEKTTGEQGLENFVPYITSKFDVFVSNEIMRPVIAQQKSSFNFREIMDTRKILLVNLSKGRLGEINANLIGLILVGKILMAALSRVDALGVKELAPFYLYIDEFQNVSTDSISQILSEARKYKLSLNIAHQFIAQLDENIKDAVFGNVGSMATFRISFEDAQYVEKKFLPIFNADDIMNIPNRNAYLQLIGHGKPLKPFNISTLPLDFFAKQYPEEIAEKIKQISFYKYGKPREEVERSIMKRFN